MEERKTSPACKASLRLLLEKATLFFSRDLPVSHSTKMLSREDSLGPFRLAEGEAPLLQSERKEVFEA